jgi:hypothetical protein
MVSPRRRVLRRPFVHEVVLDLDEGTDPVAPGAAVTVALCGHWEHEGGCRWPHNNEIQPEGDVATFRTIFVAPPAEEREVRERIELALRSAAGWSVTASGPRALRAPERALAVRLANTPFPAA